MGSLKKKKRIKYNWLFIIHDCQHDDEFADYVQSNNLKHHIKGTKVISLNRLARAYVKRFLAHKWKLYEQRVKAPCYIVGQEQPFAEWVHGVRR